MANYKKYWTFVVEGSGAFPMDMLRYDHCCPYQQEDVHWISGGPGNRSVKLVSYVGTPTPERWRSFGWSVDMVQEHRV